MCFEVKCNHVSETGKRSRAMYYTPMYSRVERVREWKHMQYTHISHDQNTLQVDTVVLANDNHNTTMWLICSTLCTQHSLWNLAHTINTVLKPRWKSSTTLQPPFGSCLYLQYRSVQDLDRRPKRHYLCFIQKLYWPEE